MKEKKLKLLEMATSVFKREYISMISEFYGNNKLLPRFIEISEELVIKFYNNIDRDYFQNKYLMSSILAKIKGKAKIIFASCSVTNWADFKTAFIKTLSDKRNYFTLT